MKNILSALLLFLTFGVCAQEVRIIDASPETGYIFDYDNPVSLVSLLKKNRLYLSYFNYEGISDEVLETIPIEDRKNLTVYYGKPGEVPLIDDDPNSPRFGDALIVTNPKSGLQSFVYDAPDTTYTDFNGITRIVIDCTPGEGDAMSRVNRITLMKRYTDTYVPVYTCYDAELLQFHGFIVSGMVEKSKRKELVAKKPTSFWNDLRNVATTKELIRPYRLNYFLSSFLMETLNSYSIKPDVWNDYDYSSDDKNRFLDDVSRQFPFSHFYGDTIWKTEETPFYGDFESYESETEKAIKHFFPKALTFIDQNLTPLYDGDPSSPNFGNELVDSLEDGTVRPVYNTPNCYVIWVEIEPYFFADGVLAFEDRTLRVEPEYLYFLEKNGKEYRSIAQFTVADYWEELLEKNGPLIPQDWSEWYTTFSEGINKADVVDIRKLKNNDEKQFSRDFWRRYD